MSEIQGNLTRFLLIGRTNRCDWSIDSYLTTIGPQGAHALHENKALRNVLRKTLVVKHFRECLAYIQFSNHDSCHFYFCYYCYY